MASTNDADKKKRQRINKGNKGRVKLPENLQWVPIPSKDKITQLIERELKYHDCQ